MCADWAIHDSENDKGQCNLHIRVLLTMHPHTENGNRIPLINKKTDQQKVDQRNRKQWKCQTVESTDWNSQENAKMWQKDLADATNEQFAEQISGYAGITELSFKLINQLIEKISVSKPLRIQKKR